MVNVAEDGFVTAMLTKMLLEVEKSVRSEYISILLFVTSHANSTYGSFSTHVWQLCFWVIPLNVIYILEPD